MVKTLQKSSSPEPGGGGGGGRIFTKLGMKHRGLQPIIVCSNDDPGVTLTYFTTSSNLETKAFL